MLRVMSSTDQDNKRGRSSRQEPIIGQLSFDIYQLSFWNIPSIEISWR